MSSATYVSSLTPDEAEPYLHCFQREYWTCDLPELQPVDDEFLPRSVRRASVSGVVAIDTVATSNDGLVIPIYQETRDQGALPAREVDQGTVAKVIIEGLAARDRDPGVDDMYIRNEEGWPYYTMRATAEYFAIDQINPTEVRTYQQTADWLVAAQTRSGRNRHSWFPFTVDYENSIEAGPYTDDVNRVRVDGAYTRAGVPTLEIGVTVPIEPIGYKRAIRAVLHQPLIIPDTSGRMPLRRRF